ncbi:MAG: M23 family metallopeptidase [Cellvibrionales bacterium]|nr:M23 family metallopeptidase [Cellvibrionales bacterium]
MKWNARSSANAENFWDRLTSSNFAFMDRKEWQAIGIAFHGNYASVWFGEKPDNSQRAAPQRRNTPPAFRPNWPLAHNAGYISSHFGWRKDPFHGRRTKHNGIDIAARRGTRVVASAAGVVASSRWRSGSGQMVKINHGNGFATLYTHLDRRYVTRGQKVDRGQAIGTVGSTGRSTGPHLHFEILKNGYQLDPLPYLKSR